MDIRHCVIPAAGLGTRFLPATKVLPKELLPLLDRPVIQWGVEEAVAAAIENIVMVLSTGKELVAAHFDSAPVLENHLTEHGKFEELDTVRRAQLLARFSYVYQAEPLGLGHAVLCAESIVGNNAFACLLPDDISWGARPVLTQLMDAHKETGTSVLALMRVPHDTIGRFSCVTIGESRGRLHRITNVVEKPTPEQLTSDLASMGRYILTPGIFQSLSLTPPGTGGEIQLTDGIGKLLEKETVWGLEFEGTLLDTGTPEGWLETWMKTAHTHPAFAPVIARAVREAQEIVQT